MRWRPGASVSSRSRRSSPPAPSRARWRACSRRSATSRRGRRRAASLAPLAAGVRARRAPIASARRGRARARAARGLRADAHARPRELRRRRPGRARAWRSDVAVSALRGLPELRPGDDLAGLLAGAAERAGGLRDGDVLCIAQKAVSKVEGRSSSWRPSTPVGAGARDRGRRGRSALDRADPAARARASCAAAARSSICETRHGLVCAAAGVDRSNTGRGRRRHPAAARSRMRPRAGCATRSRRARRSP